jgi:pimeloyl-ACP methyl ester carboxylesterase
MSLPSAVRHVALAVGVAGCALAAPAQADEPRAQRAPALPATASPTAVADPCPPEAEGAVCGHVDVPRDRRDPAAGTIAIAFELYPHTEPGPAESAIIINWGGPGQSTTALRGPTRDFLDAALGRHDLLLIDDRGRGRSGPIDCPALQHGTAPLLEAAAACAQQLGLDAVRYPTAEIARDFEVVRAALGYEAVDFIGVSYGGVDAAAYATRFGHRLRSLVLDAPVGPTTLDPFISQAWVVEGHLNLASNICARSALCGRSGERALREIRWLVQRVKRKPIRGAGLDARGEPHEVVIDARYVLEHILALQIGPYVTTGDIPAAVAAYRRGDTVPLLRLAAESDWSAPGDSGDPAEFSVGAAAATACLETPWPWSAEASLPERQQQWDAALRRAPDGPFAPFRAEDVMSAFFSPEFCLPWPQTGTRPPVEPGARYPQMPTLVLTGDNDPGLPPDQARETAELYPDARFVRITGAAHPSLFWSPCASELATEFINTLTLKSTACAAESPFDIPGVTTFPRKARDSAGVKRRHGNRADTASLRIARVAADAALDVLKRAHFPDTKEGPGLRGGTWHGDFGDTWTLTLDGVRWTHDVAVSGVLRFAFGPVEADLRIDGPGRQDGTLHLEGGWIEPSAPGSIEITGTLGGKRVVAAMPST